MVTAIVAAAGRGRRFGAPENKVFARLAGRTVLEWSLHALSGCADVEAIVVVTGAEDRARVEALSRSFERVCSVCEGGAERSDSVQNALNAVPPETTVVAIHDGARPLVSSSLVGACIAAAREHGAALPATPVSDTVKRSADGRFTLETVDRRELYAVQTPQAFRVELVREAYRAAHGAGFVGTDDASYVEHLGHPVHLVPGERTNLKITLPEDLELAEAWMNRRDADRGASLGDAAVPAEGEALCGGSVPPIPEMRTGFGYDVHRLAPGRPLWLGGVELHHPDGLGLEGHSDADVVLHAIADALLGAATLGDIGMHFPNTDERYRGIRSRVLLTHVGHLLRDHGWNVVHVDVTLLAERPRIRPHVDRMRHEIATALGMDAHCVSVKATTNECLGFVGREEGMAAHAVATIRPVG